MRWTEQLKTPPVLLLGTRLNQRVPESDQTRQRQEVEEILRRLRSQPGVILADEVGMGKTFVALAIAYSVAVCKKTGPVVVMAPANLVEKWVQDLKTFCDLYLDDIHPVQQNLAAPKELRHPRAVRYGVARHSVEFMKLLDDPPRERCHLIFLAQGAMSRSQSDKWVRLSLIAESLRRHARGNAAKLIQVRSQIHRFLGALLWAIGEERAHESRSKLWSQLLHTAPETWKDTYNRSVPDERRHLKDDPIPKSVLRAIRRVELEPLATALKEMPLRTSDRLSERISFARRALIDAEKTLWNKVLAQANWRSPLLVLDEAHHLKNPGTALARVLQSPDSTRDLRTGDGAMARRFDRMLFLTATPFQLGHYELVSVLRSFNGIRWDADELGSKEAFDERMEVLKNQLTESQRSTIALQRSWSRLRSEDLDDGVDIEQWWHKLAHSPKDSLSNRQIAVRDAYEAAKRCRELTEKTLRPWVVRHNKTVCWAGTEIARRDRIEGAGIVNPANEGGVKIPSGQLLPFFLAARSAANPSKDVLGEALCSSYEAFRYTRTTQDAGKDEEEQNAAIDLVHSRWYLTEFDSALERVSGSVHPKICATVNKAVDLWEAGEKVLVFAFYRHTCRALRIHISDEIDRRVATRAQNILSEAGHDGDIATLIERIQKRFFDDDDGRGREALDHALDTLIEQHTAAIEAAQFSHEERKDLRSTMRRFLREPTTLVRCFPIRDYENLKPADVVTRMLDHVDGSAGSWRERFDGFIDFLTGQCSESERRPYLDAVLKTETGRIPVADEGDSDTYRGKHTLANVREATGRTKRETRARLMRSFNTPFFPDIFVCSEVMGEGVDLQRHCRHVIHHDLAWNPSNIEQRTGHIDRLGCKAESRHSIAVYLPYLAGTADERQYRVMSDRERWFRVVMGQDAVAKLITTDCESGVPLPETISAELSFKLDL
jgi:superfamily II DNA or RNA helicase